MYPAEHSALSRNISCKGLLLSELAQDRRHCPGIFHFGTALSVESHSEPWWSKPPRTAVRSLQRLAPFGRGATSWQCPKRPGRPKPGVPRPPEGRGKVVETADDILHELGWGTRPRVSPGKSPRDPLLTKMGSRRKLRVRSALAAVRDAGPETADTIDGIGTLGADRGGPGGRFIRGRLATIW